MPTTPERLRNIRQFDELIRYLEDELEWPLQQYGFDELTSNWPRTKPLLSRVTFSATNFL